jgi:hypothetical protein
MENDSDKLVRLGVKAALDPSNTEAVKQFCHQLSRCQNRESSDGTCRAHTWDLAYDLKHAIISMRNAQKDLDDRLRRLEYE